MKIYIIAKPKKKKEYIEQIDSTHYTVAIKEPPINGKANKAIIDSLAGYFTISKSQIFFISGQTSNHKTFEVPDYLVNFEPPLKQVMLF
jgi:hypothetical protein